MSTKPAAPPSTGLGVLTIVLTLLGWASVPLFLRHFAHSIDLWTSNGWRYGFSALVWAPVLVFAALSARGNRLPRGLWKAAIVPSIVNAAGQVCFAWAFYRAEPGLVTFGLRTQLIFVAIGAWILFPAERAIIRRPGYLIGALILLIGMTAVVLLDDGATSTAPDQSLTSTALVESAQEPVHDSDGGDVQSNAGVRKTGLAPAGSRKAHFEGVALALASGLLFACYGLAVRKYMHNINPVLAFAAICQYTALALVALMFILGNEWGSEVFDLPGFEILMLLGSALIGIAIGHVFYYYSIARLGVAVTAGVLQLQPFIVALASLWLFGEVLNLWQWTGGTIAVSGALLMLSVQWRVSHAKRVIKEAHTLAEGESGS